MTSSVAGLFGNFGQANYSSAKLGLVELSNTLAVEGARFGIQSNVIVPMAASRLTKDILPPDMFVSPQFIVVKIFCIFLYYSLKLKQESLGPEHIAPVVAWMCHEQCTVCLSPYSEIMNDWWVRTQAW